jgi:hypothetical protein
MRGDKEDLQNSSERFLDFIGGLNVLKLSKEQTANPKTLISFKSLKSYPGIDFSDTIQEFVDSMINTELVINSKRMTQVTEQLKQAFVIPENSVLFHELRNQSKDTVISKELDYTNDNNMCMDSKRMVLSSKATRDFDMPARGRMPIEAFDVDEFIKLKENSNIEARDANLRILIAGFAWEIQQLREKIGQMKTQDNSSFRGSSTQMHRREKSRFNRIANQQADSSKTDGEIFKLDSDNLDNKPTFKLGKTGEGNTNLINNFALTNSNLFLAETFHDSSDAKTPEKRLSEVAATLRAKNLPTDSLPEGLAELSAFFGSKSLRQEITAWEAKLLAKERKLETIINKLLKNNIVIKPMDSMSSPIN